MLTLGRFSDLLIFHAWRIFHLMWVGNNLCFHVASRLIRRYFQMAVFLLNSPKDINKNDVSSCQCVWDNSRTYLECVLVWQGILVEIEACIDELDVHIIIRECCRQILCQKLETFIARNWWHLMWIFLRFCDATRHT